MVKLTKKQKLVQQSIDVTKSYSLSEAVDLLKTHAAAKFDETFEVAICLGLDPRQADQNLRGAISLPHGTGKKVRVAVISNEVKHDEARKAGADLIAGPEFVDEIKQGAPLDFDVLVVSPDMMPQLGKVGKILGPKGLMPNPKVGTVTNDIAAAVQNLKAGQVHYRVDKAGIIHAGVGKVSFDQVKLVDNIQTLIDALNKVKPTSTKGTYMKKVALTTTMGPGLTVDLTTL